MKNFKNFKNKCNCKHCGSSNVKMIILTENKDYELKALTLKQPKAKKIINDEIEDFHWVCYGDCNDETSVNLSVDGNVFDDNIDLYLKYIANGKNIKKNIVFDIYDNNIDNVKEYIKNGGNLDSFLIEFDDTLRFNQYSSLLLFAIDEGKCDIVKLLIDNGADVNLGYSSFGHTPLMEIITQRQVRKCPYKTKIEIIDLMFEHGLDITKTDNDGDDYTKLDYSPKFKDLHKYIQNYNK